MIFGGLHASSPAVAFELMWTFDLQCDTCDIPSLLLTTTTHVADTR